MNVFDNIKVDIICPNCGEKQSPTIKQLRSSSYKCISCQVIFDANDFDQSIAEMETQLKQFGR